MRRVLRLALPAMALLALYYAVFGGEYSALELRQIRAEERRQRAELDSLRIRIDSLAMWADSLEGDSATLERVARERYGLIREGETLYRFTGPEQPPDSTGGS